MSVTLAFDVYGTLIDTNGVVEALRQMIGDRAGDFSRVWRNKQLEYSFRRGLMRDYRSFDICTAQALDYTCGCFITPLSTAQKNELLGNYRKLPAYEDVQEALRRLTADSFRLYAFSNGKTEAVEAVLLAAGIRDFFLGIVSVDELQTFKPNPAVYKHFLEKSGAAHDSAWLISGNPFDVIGALAAGIKAAWVKRSPEAIFDPWGIEPTITVSSLIDLADQITGVIPTENAARIR